MKPPYDGSINDRVPFLNHLDIRRCDEMWSPIMQITHDGKQLDLIREFTKIPSSTILAVAKQRWESSTIDINKCTFGHQTFYARCSAKLLLGSITEMFSITIIDRINPALHNDGPLILWTICQHTYRINIAFIEKIKMSVRSAMLMQFDNDIQHYIFLRDNLHLITSASESNQTHMDLLTYIFNMLTTSSITPFKEEVQKWHITYLEAQDHELTPDDLIA